MGKLNGQLDSKSTENVVRNDISSKLARWSQQSKLNMLNLPRPRNIYLGI